LYLVLIMVLNTCLASLLLFLTVVAGEEGCPPGWVNSVEGCFLFDYTKALNWRDAQEVCESMGGFLAEVKTEEQAMLLTSLAVVQESILGISAWWVGLTEQGHQGRWVWQHSVEDTTYTNWAPDYPDYTNTEDDCVVMASRDSFMWSNTDCGGLAACPVCQREAEWSDGTTTQDTQTTTQDTQTTTQDTTTTSPQFHVELRGGDGKTTGNVFAVNRNGILGPVCDDFWENKDAMVVCRQIGCLAGARTTESYFGDVMNIFAMDNVACNGDEDHLQECLYDISEDCSYNEAAGVKCSFCFN